MLNRACNYCIRRVWVVWLYFSLKEKICFLAISVNFIFSYASSDLWILWMSLLCYAFQTSVIACCMGLSVERASALAVVGDNDIISGDFFSSYFVLALSICSQVQRELQSRRVISYMSNILVIQYFRFCSKQTHARITYWIHLRWRVLRRLKPLCRQYTDRVTWMQLNWCQKKDE